MPRETRTGAGGATSYVTVLVDARGLYSSGIGRYVREIVRVVLRDARFCRVKLLGDLAAIDRYAREEEAGERIEGIEYRGAYYSLRSQREWLQLLSSGLRADVSFFPHYDAPLLALPERSVVTVHDLTQYKVPEVFAWWRRQAGTFLLSRAVSQASRLIVGSESARADLTERFPGASDRAVVIPHGVSEIFRPLGKAERQAGIGELDLIPFILCVGNRKPHKNLVTAVEAFALLRRDYPELRLVVAGRFDVGWGPVAERARALGVFEHIIDVGEVDDERLRLLYALSEVFLFPSLYEGFGLPVIEAMACGCPVVATNRASLPEVVGEAGLLIEPLNPAAIAETLGRLLSDRELRSQMVNRAIDRARNYTWSEAGRRTADLLHHTATAEKKMNAIIGAPT